MRIQKKGCFSYFYKKGAPSVTFGRCASAMYSYAPRSYKIYGDVRAPDAVVDLDGVDFVENLDEDFEKRLKV